MDASAISRASAPAEPDAGRNTNLLHLPQRRALIFVAPSLLLPTAVLAAAAPTPDTAEGPFCPVSIPSDDDADLVSVEGGVRKA